MTPFFVNDPYDRTIQEGQPLNIRIVTVEARDTGAAYNQIRYSLIGTRESLTYFAINDVSGDVYLNRSLVGVSSSIFTLNVVASDNGVPPKQNSTVFTITINHNQNCPIFSPKYYQAFIAENTALGTVLVNVTAIDLDTVAPYNTLEYFIKSGTGSDNFVIDSRTGMLKLARSLSIDTSGVSQYNIIIGVRDLAPSSCTAIEDATVFIQVQRNQNPPVFINDPYRVTIPETRPIGDIVAQFTVQDADTVSPFNVLTLTLVGDDDGPTYFSFDPTTRRVMVARNLTLQTGTFYRLRVVAVDGGTPPKSATALAEITILKNLKDPAFSPLSYTTTIDETLPPGSSVLRVTATDADTSSPYNLVSYSLTETQSNSQALSYFAIDKSTGDVYVRQSIYGDTSRVLVYRFGAACTDNGLPTQRPCPTTASIEINIRRNR
ncbi:hypothetical protein ACJMK2_035674 [Sinanodonta woodiana]|uniref:Cadherin domain-containing protein n=1 Tax=Sinanodonta woodiana TaxID=1069815 RepID=A0ABD3WZL8_SINWO